MSVKAGQGPEDLRPRESGRSISDVVPRATRTWASVDAASAAEASKEPTRALSPLFEPEFPPPSAPVSGLPVVLPEGTRIGRYEVIRELGRGGMGVVLLARDDKLGRRVAIKVLQSMHAELARRFIIEARATARCNHENIVIIHEVGEHAGSPFMVLEYLRGQPLSSLAPAGAPMQTSRAVEIMASVARALTYAHRQGIVHRDLKLDNVFITESGTVKVLDFGIAKLLQDESRYAEGPIDLARAREIFWQGSASGPAGTIACMSPQQWGQGGEIDDRTDVWSAGIMLFQLLSGQHPFAPILSDPLACVAEVRNLERAMPKLGDVAPHVPRELAALVDACLQKRLEHRVRDAAALLRGLEPFLPGRFVPSVTAIEAGPYAGLRSFQEDDAGRFFGRTQEIRAIVTRIRDVPMLGVVGPSGIGKSSLIRAGVGPALKSSDEHWDVLVVRPGRDPVLALANLIAPLVGATTSVTEELGAQNDLRRLLLEQPGFLGRVLRSTCRTPGKRVLLFVDQFEELYTHGARASDRRAFTDCLGGAADDATSPVRIVVSVRSDFVGRIAENPHFMNELSHALFFLAPPTSDGLREALVHPAELVGYRFESPAMVEDMVRHLEATPGGLPLLQFTASQLWDLRDPSARTLTEQSYHQLGGIAGALVSHADRVIEQLTPELQQLSRAVFVHLVTPERTRAVRDVAELRELTGHDSAIDVLLETLVDARLLIVQTGSAGAATVELVHESLIVSWPKLRRWLEETHEDSVFVEQLLAAARQWRAKRHDSGLLWSGEMVQELRRFQRRHRGALPEVGAQFSAAVFEQHERGQRRRRALTVGGTVVLLGLLAAATVGLIVISNANSVAQERAEEARIAELKAQRRLAEREKAEAASAEANRQRLEALKKEATAQTEVFRTNEELARKNLELVDALDRAEQQRALADASRLRAEANERDAREAEEKARRAEQKALEAEAREAKRADDLQKQLGSPMVEVLR